MELTVTRRSYFNISKIGLQSLSVFFLSTLCPYAFSANWQFAPSVETSLSYVDNINLATETTAENSNIYELTPGFSLTANGPHVQAMVDYRLQALMYSNNPQMGGGSDTEYFPRLVASANGQLLERLFFVDAAASVSQQYVSGIGEGLLDNYSITDSRSTVRRVTLSPYLHHQVGSGVMVELRYRYNELESETDIIENSSVNTVVVDMNSGNFAGRWQWSVNASTSEVDFESQSDQTRYFTDFGLGYHISSRTVVTLNGGTEKIDYQPSSVGGAGGDYWMLGMDWQPGRRTDISLQAGESFYGRSYGLSIRHRARRFIFRTEYLEELTNSSLVQFEQQLVESGTTTTPEGDEVIVFDVIGYPVLSTDIILRKSLAAQIVWRSAKSTLTVGTGNIVYDYQGSDFRENVNSLRVVWQWRMKENMTLDVSRNFNHCEFLPAGTIENIQNTEIRISRAVFPGGSASLTVAGTRNNSDINGQDFVHRRITAAFSMQW